MRTVVCFLFFEGCRDRFLPRQNTQGEGEREEETERDEKSQQRAVFEFENRTELFNS